MVGNFPEESLLPLCGADKAGTRMWGIERRLFALVQASTTGMIVNVVSWGKMGHVIEAVYVEDS